MYLIGEYFFISVDVAARLLVKINSKDESLSMANYGIDEMKKLIYGRLMKKGCRM